jgi:two-component system cell cycle sensor histidine kinase/response regulator CckA
MICVMVVEDEGPIREMIVEVLCEEGFQIIEAPSADAAVELLELPSLRLIVTDINLPGMRDGIDLAIAARNVRPGIPVIFISGRPMKLVDASQAITNPTSFLLKPFTFQALIEDIERLAGANST